jgi:ubiquinone/menaquinone biosynthesis C-methylase UbiE
LKNDIERIVKSYYGTQAQCEWFRLSRNPYRKIEFMLTMHFLKKYLPKKGLVLDAGGGPGRYTIQLAKLNYDVVLLDIVPKMLETARKKARRAGVLRRIKQFTEGSIEDLSAFADETFDAVLCLGAPLNHLLKANQREKAASELARVAKKDAPIFASVISRIGLLKSILTDFPQEMKYAKNDWEVGDYVPSRHRKGFTASHWFLPEELRTLFERQHLQTLEMAGLEGLSSHHRKETNRLYKDKARWKMWTEILLKTCNNPAVVGSAEHFLIVSNKQK